MTQDQSLDISLHYDPRYDEYIFKCAHCIEEWATKGEDVVPNLLDLFHEHSRTHNA